MHDKEFLAGLLIEAAELLDEGAVKTSKKHKLDNYLAKYNYQGDKKSGTIEVDGKKYNVDRDTKNFWMETKGRDCQRSTSSDLSNNKDGKQFIHLDKNFEKLKNDKRRDAVLQHEIGHLKLHSHDIDSKHLQKDRLSKSNPRALAHEQGKSGFMCDYEDYREMQQNNKNTMKYEHDAKEIRKENKKSGNDKMQSERDKNIGKFKKYESDEDPHSNTMEYEADAYSTAHSSLADRKRSLRETRKHAKKDVHYDRNEYNKLMDADYNARIKALKDKSINRKVYNETTELADLLIEAADLLSDD